MKIPNTWRQRWEHKTLLDKGKKVWDRVLDFRGETGPLQVVEGQERARGRKSLAGDPEMRGDRGHRTGSLESSRVIHPGLFSRCRFL